MHTLLRAYAEERELFDEIFYWSPTQAGAIEIDFLLRRGRSFLAVEVKSQRRFTPSLLAGLHAIADLPGLVRRVLVYTGDRELRTPEGIDVLPVPRFLEAIKVGRLWP